MNTPFAGEKILTAVNRTGFAVHCSTRTHTVTSDEPRDHGGSDTGPTPVELLLAALASCTAITVRMYAQRKEWPLEEIDVRVRGTTSASAQLESAALSVRFKGNLSPEQRARLLDIAHKCPVHRVLAPGVNIPPITTFE